MTTSNSSSFWDHAEALRGVLLHSLVAIVLCSVVVFCFKETLFDHIVFAPLSSDFVVFELLNRLAYTTDSELFIVPHFSISIQNIDIAAQFFTHVNVSGVVGFILAIPYILYQLWKFVSPALYEGEKRGIRRVFFFCSILFIVGVMVGYFLVLPFTIRFLGTYHVSYMVDNVISLQSYIHTFTWLLIIMGLSFELPLLLRGLSAIKLVSRKGLKKYRRHALVFLLIFAAVITPSGDAFTLLVVALPLYLLYEFSILVCYDFVD